MSHVPKLLISAEPGRLLVGPALEFCRTWPHQREVTVKGIHYNEAPRSKLRGITELNSEDFSEGEANPVASYGECQVQEDSPHEIGTALQAFVHSVRTQRCLDGE